MSDIEKLMKSLDKIPAPSWEEIQLGPAFRTPMSQEAFSRTRLHGRRMLTLVTALGITAAAGIGIWKLTGLVGHNAVPRLPGTGPAGASEAPTVQATIDVGDSPSRVALGPSGVWVTTEGAPAGGISRIDPETNEVILTQQIEDGPTDLVVDTTAVWVTADAETGQGRILRIDPESGRVLAEITHIEQVCWLASGGGSLWVSRCDGDALLRIDPQESQIVDTIEVAGVIRDIEADSESVWVLNPDRGVYRVGTIDGEVSALIPIDVETLDLAVGGGFAWVSSTDGRLFRINPQTEEIDGEWQLGDLAGTIAWEESGIWFDGFDAREDTHTVARFNPDTGVVDVSVAVEDAVIDIAVGFDSIWGVVHATALYRVG